MAVNTYQPRVAKGVREGGRYSTRVRTESRVSLAAQHPRALTDPKSHTHGHLESMRSVLKSLEDKRRSRRGFTEHDRQHLLNTRRLHELLEEAVSSVSSDAEAVRFLMWKHDQLAQAAKDTHGSDSVWPWVRRTAEKEARAHRALAHDAREAAQLIQTNALQRPASPGGETPPSERPAPELSARRRTDSLGDAIQGHMSRLPRLSREYERARITLGVLSEASKGASSDQEVVGGLRKVYDQAMATYEAATLEAGRAATFQQHQEHLKRAERARSAMQDAVELRNRLVPLRNAAHT